MEVALTMTTVEAMVLSMAALAMVAMAMVVAMVAGMAIVMACRPRRQRVARTTRPLPSQPG